MNILFKNSLLYIAATFAVKATSFLLVPFYSYLISPDDYGYVFVVYSIVDFMSLFVICSMHGSISRFYWECSTINDVRKMYSTITIMVAIISILILIPIALLCGSISNMLEIPEIYLHIAIVSSALHAFYWLITSLLYQRKEAKKMSITSIAVGAVQIVIQLFLVIIMDNKAMAMILSQLFCGLFMFLLFVVYSIPYLRFSFDRIKAWSYFKYGICLVPSELSLWFLSFSDRIMVNKMKGSSSAGIYGMGQTLGGIPKLIFSSINNAYGPFVYECYKGIDKGDLLKADELKKNTTLVFSIMTLLITILIVFSNNIVSMLNERYAQAVMVMAVMLFSMLIECYRKIFMNPLYYNVKYAKIASLIWVSAAILNISLNLYLIPIYSIYGACFSMVFSYSLTFLLIISFANKAYHVEYETKRMVVIFVISVITCLLTFIDSAWSLVPLKILGIVIYTYLVVRLSRIKVLEVCKSIIGLFKK